MGVVEAIAITATVTLFIAGALFYFLHRARRASRVESRFDIIEEIIVDEEGLDLIYFRKLKFAHSLHCFSKVWHNPMQEEVKKIVEPVRLNPVQAVPLLQGHAKSEMPLPPPPPPPAAAAALPKSAPPPPPPVKRNAISSSRRPPVPPRGNNKEVGDENRVEMKLKPLHWDKVIANADHSMVWNEIIDGSCRFDDDLMVDLFGYTKTATEKCRSGCRASSSFSCMFLLDPRKSQNTAIILKSLQISREEILNALLEGQGLNVDTLKKLAKIRPTHDEEAKILEFQGNPARLADAESFLYHILKAVPSAFIRINAMLFRTTYDHDILHLKQSLQTLELACKELRNGDIFYKLLEAILKAGNKMNAGTNRGNAQGFNLTALQRLSEVRSTDGKTFLHFVVEQVVQSEARRCLMEPGGEHLMHGLRVMESLNTDLTNLKKAASIDYDSMITTCPVLTSQVNEIRQMLTQCHDMEPGGFLRITKRFLEDCHAELNVVRDQEKRVMDVVGKTWVYFQAGGAKDREGNNPFQLFAIFKDFLSNVDQVCAEIHKKLHKTTIAASSSPLSPTMRSPVRFQNLEMHIKARRNGTSDTDSEDDF